MTVMNSRKMDLIGRQVAEIDRAGDLVFDAALVAPFLGLAPDTFMEALRKGLIHHVHEQGTGEDSAKRRVTFRYRARQSVLTLDALGHVLDVG